MSLCVPVLVQLVRQVSAPAGQPRAPGAGHFFSFYRDTSLMTGSICRKPVLKKCPMSLGSPCPMSP